jgi:predicted MFS family arabinose efflux permease
MGWIAFSAGAAFAGNAFQNFGIVTASFISTALPVIGIIFIITIHTVKNKNEAPIP